MKRFTEAIKAKYPDARLKEAQATIRRLQKRVVPESDGYMLSPGSMAPSMVHDLMQCGLRRTLEIVDAAIREVNEEHINTSCLLARAAFETICLVYDATLKVKQVVDSNDTAQLADLYEYLRKVVVGGKSKHRLSEEIQSPNILTVVQRVSKQFDDIPWQLCEVLSEYAHPNYHGMLATYTEIGKAQGVTRFVDKRPGRVKAAMHAALSALTTGLDLLGLAFSNYDKFLEPFAILAEKRNFEEGKWPQDLPFPLLRPLKWRMPGEPDS